MIALNTLFCAILFAPWVLPRETVSGLLGRWHETETGWKRTVAAPLVSIVDLICWWDPSHCAHTYDCERQLRLLRERR